MVQILRVTSRWSGFSGSPGYTVFHMRDFDTSNEPSAAQAGEAVTKARAFWNTVNTALPSAVSIQVNNEVEVLEDSTGELLSTVTSTIANAAVSGTMTGSVAGPAGAVINWRTGSIRRGRRIRGRTFLVPLAVGAYEANGTLTTTARDNITLGATNLIAQGTGPELGVYARPSGPGATDGQWVVATGTSVPDMVAVLRSRRG